jgi:predicted SprT family Zn-dependent metalloprotease
MQLSEVTILAEGLLRQHGLHDWTFQLNKNKRRLGVCRQHLRRIELSQYYVERNPPEHILDTLIHEIAHAIVGVQHGHDQVWKDMCLELGCAPVSCDGSADMPEGKWQATCPTCSRHFAQHRRPKRFRRHFCLACGPEDGRLSYTELTLLPKTLTTKPAPGKPRQLFLNLEA